MKIEALSKKFFKSPINAKDGSVVPYELIIKDSNGVTSIGGYCDIPESDMEGFLRIFMKSYEVGGVNFHISESLGFVPYPNKVTFKKYGQVQYVWNAPMFMVW